MTSSTDAQLSFRRYGADGPAHDHGHAQIVLPVEGALEIEVGGRRGRVDAAGAAFIAPGTAHSQQAWGPNRFLVVDCGMGGGVGAPDAAMLDRLGGRPFVAVTPAMRRLIEFIDLSGREPAALSTVARHWTPLLLDALMTGPARPVSRLHVLLDRLRMAPGERWTTMAMARTAGLSVSRLHALFREELDQTPLGYLANLRLRWVMDRLAGTTLSIAEIAYQAGYADQSALTRALRRATGITPAAYRDRQRGR